MRAFWHCRGALLIQHLKSIYKLVQSSLQIKLQVTRVSLLEIPADRYTLIHYCQIVISCLACCDGEVRDGGGAAAGRVDDHAAEEAGAEETRPHRRGRRKGASASIRDDRPPPPDGGMDEEEAAAGERAGGRAG
jgi:hypothetical protein